MTMTPQTPWRTPRRGGARYAARVAVLLAWAAVATGAAAATMYDGRAQLPKGKLAGASAALDLVPGAVAGTLSLTMSDPRASGAYGVTGSLRGIRLVLNGTSATGGRLRWKGRQRAAGTLDGPFRVKAPGVRVRGKLTLVARGAGSTACDDYFRGQVMTQVLVPICAQCHVAGGLAAGTRLQVAPDDPVATEAATRLVIDQADPPSSLLLRKPTGLVGHGGGVKLSAGSAELAVLQGWVDRVTTGACNGTTVPGGGGGGDPGAQLYLDNCASCHGTDTLGVGGRPLLRCNRDVAESVRMGRDGPTPETTMPPFPALTDADIALIQGYLDGLCPATTATGADLFAGNCAFCHGSDARGASGPDVHCARAIGDMVRNGVVGVFGKMDAMLHMTDPEIRRIQDHLLTLCPIGSAGGPALYASNCAGCHGASGAGAGTRPDIRCAAPSRVNDAVRDGRGITFPVMPSYGTDVLTGAELAGVRAFIAASCPGTPAALYAGNCSTCHGPTGSGGESANQLKGPNIRCKSLGDVTDAVVDGSGGMPAIPDLTSPQISAITTFLCQ
jgi:mono/diheme cytochrome c family protein